MPTSAMSSALSMGPAAQAPRGTPWQYIAGMYLATLSMQTARHRRQGPLARSLVLLACLGLSMALLAGCGKPAPDAPAVSAPGQPPAPASRSSSAPAEPAATPAPASAALPSDAAASAPPAAAAAARPPAAAAPAARAMAVLPPAIVAFQQQRDACDHFRGEEPYDKQRAAFLKAQLAKTCKGSDKALAALRKRFANDPEALAALKGYEDRIE